MNFAPRAGALWRVVLALLVLATVVLMTTRATGWLPRFAATIDAMGPLGAVAFIAGYAVACVALVPASILTLAAGALFGLIKGTALVFAGATLGSAAAFLVGRHLVRGAVERRLQGDARFDAIDRAIGADGRRIVFLLRLSPVFPFVLLNYALGLTRVTLADYLIGGVGMLPGTVLYVYYGRLAGDVAALASGASAPRHAGYYAVLFLGLVATILVTTVVTRMARAALRAQTDAGTSAPPLGSTPTATSTSTSRSI